MTGSNLLGVLDRLLQGVRSEGVDGLLGLFDEGEDNIPLGQGFILSRDVLIIGLK